MKRGTTEIRQGGDSFGPVACPEHRGESIVGYEPSTDEAHLDGAGFPLPDAMRVEDPRGGIEWSVPVRSEEVGHVPSCRACAIQAFETADHVRTALGLPTPRPTRPEGY